MGCFSGLREARPAPGGQSVAEVSANAASGNGLAFSSPASFGPQHSGPGGTPRHCSYGVYPAGHATTPFTQRPGTSVPDVSSHPQTGPRMQRPRGLPSTTGHVSSDVVAQPAIATNAAAKIAGRITLRPGDRRSPRCLADGLSRRRTSSPRPTSCPSSRRSPPTAPSGRASPASANGAG